MVNACKEYTMFSWSAQGKVAPIPMVKAEGCHFWDADGNKWFDMNSQLMCSNIGHGNKKVIQAIKDQAEELTYAGPGFATRVRAEIGPLLAKHTPGGMNHFFFTLGGAEANENALKFARFYTGKSKIITRNRSYHGATHAAIMCTGDYRRFPNEQHFPMGGIIRVQDTYKYRSLLYREGDTDQEFAQRLLDHMEETIKFENPGSIAAVLIETVTGTNGILIPPAGYLQGVRKLCDKYNIVMICDEVMAGLGRTGQWFAVDHWGVVPDIITCAKGLTSGYLPLGGVIVSDKIAQHFSETPFLGGLTYQSHPMCLAAAVATLKVMEEPGFMEHVQKMGLVMTELHLKMKEKHKCVGDVRSIGLFGAVELVKSRKTKEMLVDEMLQLGAFLKSKHMFHFIWQNILLTIPPLIVSEQELRDAFVTIDEGLTLVDKLVE